MVNGDPIYLVYEQGCKSISPVVMNLTMAQCGLTSVDLTGEGIMEVKNNGEEDLFFLLVNYSSDVILAAIVQGNSQYSFNQFPMAATRCTSSPGGSGWGTC